MTLIRKRITFSWTADAAPFDADGHPGPDAIDLDFYMFEREARMDEAWGSVRGVAVGPRGSDRIQAPTVTGQRQNDHHGIAELLREIAQHMLIAVAVVKQWFS